MTIESLKWKCGILFRYQRSTCGLCEKIQEGVQASVAVARLGSEPRWQHLSYVLKDLKFKNFNFGYSDIPKLPTFRNFAKMIL